MPQQKRERNGGSPAAKKRRTKKTTKTQAPLSIENLPNDMLRLIHQKVGARNVRNAVKLSAVSKTFRNTVPKNALYTRPDLVKGNDPRTHTFPKGHMLPTRLDVTAMKERLTLLYNSVRQYDNMTRGRRGNIGRRAAYSLLRRVVLENAKDFSTIQRRDAIMRYASADFSIKQRLRDIDTRRVAFSSDECSIVHHATLQWRDPNGVPFDVCMDLFHMETGGLEVRVWISNPADFVLAFIVGSSRNEVDWSEFQDSVEMHGYSMFTYANIQYPDFYIGYIRRWTQRHTIDTVRILNLLKALSPRGSETQRIILADGNSRLHAKPIINNLPKFWIPYERRQ